MLYFAYGSNMDPGQMARRCPGSEPLGAARLPGYRLRFCWDSPGWGGGVADVQPADGEEVWGVLWRVTPDNVASLDEYEGVAAGVYRKHDVTVEHDGARAEAFLYIMAPERAEKPPSQRYITAIVRGAEAHRLPDAYVAGLAAAGGRR